MAFLDNSGDIILDAVLTDTGRMRLAKGDGSFRIAKFALGDDEIDYSLYNSNNASGSAYFDLEILQTPILEAFTNNASSMKSKLLSITKNNLLYLPVIKLNNKVSKVVTADGLIVNGYALAVDKDTQTFLLNGGTVYNGDSLSDGTGVITGKSVAESTAFIQVDQGQDTTEIPVQTIDTDLKETQYLVEIDNRFGAITDLDGNVQTPSYIDDDNIATYYFSFGVDDALIGNLPIDTVENQTVNQVIAGPRGTYLNFKIASQNEVATSDYLFNQIGKDLTTGFSASSLAVTNIRGILTSVRITGITTGNSIDVPLMIIKKIAP